MAERTSPGKEDPGSRPAGVIMECGYRGEPGRRPAIEQAPAAGRGEHRWPVAVAIIVALGLHVALPARHRVPGWVVPVVLLVLLAVLITEDPGRTSRQRTWLRIVTGIVIAPRWSSPRAPRNVLSSPFHTWPRAAPISRTVPPAPQDTQARKEQRARGLLTVQAAVACSSARIRVPFHRASQASHPLHHPPWAGTAEGRIPGRSTDRVPDPRFPSYAQAGPAMVPAQHPAGLAQGAGACGDG
jgi:hypothetical protein